MNLTRKIKIAQKVLSAKILKKYCPLTVSWAITRRCRQRCSYCGVVVPKEELSTEEIFTIIDKLSRFGTERISFTGGEPLLREDLGRIIDYAKGKGIVSVVNTNGDLLKQAIQKLSNVERITMSFDGPDEVHRELRRGNSHHLEAIKLCRSEGIPIVLTTVLSKLNLDYIDYILDIAQKFNIKVLFQPAQLNLLGQDKTNPLALEKQQLQDQIERLIKEKSQGNSHIYNSLSGLRHLKHWPEAAVIPCWAAKLHCRIDSDGYIYPCGHTTAVYKERSIFYKDLNDYNELYDLVPVGCRHCWCASIVEYNLALSFNTDSLRNIIDNENHFFN